MTSTALRVPFSMLEPVELVDFDPSKPETWATLAGIPEDSIDFISYPHFGVQMLHDGNGLIRGDHEGTANMRIALFEAYLNGGVMRYDRVLVGNFLLIGTDGDDTVDIPPTIIDAMAECSRRAVVFDRQVSERRAQEASGL